jgi:hypothetical protein
MDRVEPELVETRGGAFDAVEFVFDGVVWLFDW